MALALAQAIAPLALRFHRGSRTSAPEASHPKNRRWAFKGFSARDRRILVQAIEEQLTHQPTFATRNRKRLRENPLATWELRVQEFRVLYNVDQSIVTVFVVAIAVKEGNKFIIEGEEYPL